MPQIQPEIGFIGFFDILGYSQIMLNNNIHKTSQFVSDTLMNIPKDLISRLRNIHANDNNQQMGHPFDAEEWQRMLDKVQWIIFSDSILISMPMNPEMDALSQTNLIWRFQRCVLLCSTKLFQLVSH